jgi:hypothetical protein
MSKAVSLWVDVALVSIWAACIIATGVYALTTETIKRRVAIGLIVLGALSVIYRIWMLVASHWQTGAGH